MLKSLRKLNDLLTYRDRRSLAILFVMMVGAAVLEVIGVGAIPAFISILAFPEQSMKHSLVRNSMERFGIVRSEQFVVLSVIVLIIVFAVKNAYLVSNYYLQMKFIRSRRIDLGRRLTNAYLSAPYTFYLDRSSSELSRNVERETSLIAYHVLAPLLETCTRMLILAGVVLFLFVVEPWITLVWLMVFGLIAAFGINSLSSRLKHFGLQEQVHRQQVLQSLLQSFGSIKESRILGREQFFAKAIESSILRTADASFFRQFTGSAMAPLTEFLAMTGLLIIAAALVVLGRPAESITVTMALFIVGLIRLREAVSAGMTHFTNLRYNIVAVDPVWADLKALERPTAAETEGRPASPPRRVQECIEIRDVRFRYDISRSWALQDVCLTIPTGAAVAFVGGTGAGKSTLVDIILGLLKPDEGRVLVDGSDIHSGSLRSWQSNIGYVPQSIYLLDDTIRRNIAFGLDDADIDDRAVWAAAEAAHLRPLLDKIPDGLNTLVGERGARLSGGERQRIGIARALYHNPQVVVMDEATSSLDNTTERAVISAVEQLKGSRTLILIAHRLTTVQRCDTLYFLEAGRIEASGTFTELQASSREFRLMAAGG